MLKVTLDIRQLHADHLQTLLYKTCRIRSHAVLVFNGVAIVGINPQIDDVYAAFQVDVGHRKPDVAGIFVDYSCTHTAHIIAGGLIQWTVVNQHILFLDVRKTGTTAYNYHSLGRYQRVAILAFPHHRYFAFLVLNRCKHISFLVALNLKAARRIGVVYEMDVNRRLVVKVFVKEQMRLPVCHREVQLLDDILYHLMRLEEVNLFLCRAGRAERLHHVLVYLLVWRVDLHRCSYRIGVWAHLQIKPRTHHTYH